MTNNSAPSSEFEHEDRCPSCGSLCNIHTDLDNKDYCNDCRPSINNKQSSLEWFSKESWKLKVKLENKEITIGEYGVTYVDLLKQAKAMHKEEMRLSYNQGLMSNFQNFEDFYNETFGGNK